MKKPISESFTHLSTDYYRGTTMEPESISKLRASYGEYEALGQQHREVSSRLQTLQEAMKMSRQNGAFQALQNQMKEVKELVKKKEDLDAKMAVADLARKKDDDHKLAVQQEVSYSEKLGSLSDRISQLAEMVMEYGEFSEEEFDFTRCQRPDGTTFGTAGMCGAPNKPIAKEQPMTAQQKIAYKAGGGDAAAKRSGKSAEEVAASGTKNIARMSAKEKLAYKAGGGDAAILRSGKGFDTARSQGKTNVERMSNKEKLAYKAGGGDAAVLKSGKGYDTAREAGKKNVERMSDEEKLAHKAGGGDAAVLRSGKGYDTTRAAGKKNVERMSDEERLAYKGGGGDADVLRSGKGYDTTRAQGKQNIDKMSNEERGAYKGGGGDAAARRSGGGLDKVTAQGRINMERMKPEDKAAYQAGGGGAAVKKGSSIEQVISQGRSNIARRKEGKEQKTEPGYSEISSFDENFDFTRCQRPDGSFYGTRGKCKKGANAGAAAPKAPAGGGAAKPSPKQQMKELAGILREKTAPFTAMKKQLKSAEKAFAAMEKATRKDRSPENIAKLKSAGKALAKKTREVARAQRELEKITRAWSRARTRHERSKMSPAQLASERALDREMRLRG